MALHIIIDGYNFIRQSAELSLLDRADLQAGRDSLLDLLAAYKRLKGHRITVVFDGADAPGALVRRDRVKGINIRFSRGGESADAVIKRMAAREKEKALVVSSDRAVVDHCLAQGAAAISSPQFEQRAALADALDGDALEDQSDSGWVPTTRKKGPRRRLPRKKRRSRMRIKKL
jgi:predicted RNA-binding protein with PIN domain